MSGSVSRTVLLVDDEPSISTLMGRFLEHRGWLPLVAESGAEGLRIVESYPEEIDLLITDVVMAGMDGFSLAAQVSCLRPDTRILYITGHSADTLGVGQGLREAGRFFLIKPFDQRTFLEAVDMALERPVAATDAVAMLLGNPLVEATPLTGNQADGNARYAVDLPLTYHWAGMEAWRAGRTRVIGRSVVELVTSGGGAAPPAGAAGDLRIELPYPGARSAVLVAAGRVLESERRGTDGLDVVVRVASYHPDIRA